MGTVPDQQCPGLKSTWAVAAEQVTQAGSAMPWLHLGHGGRLTPNPVPGTHMLGKSQDPLGDSQEPSAHPQGCFGSSPRIEFLLNWAACPH